jgi:hypothetical protein
VVPEKVPFFVPVNFADPPRFSEPWCARIPAGSVLDRIVMLKYVKPPLFAAVITS